MTEKRWLVFDTETTGLPLPAGVPLDKQPKIIEIALVEIVSGAVTREYSALVNPGEQITEEITKITKLTNDDLKDAPPFVSIVNALVDDWFLGAYGLVAHNLPFDMNMLVLELKRLNRDRAFPYPPKQYCTVSEFHHVKGRRMKLTELYSYSLSRELKQTHRALDDARALAEICLKEGVCQ